MPGLTRPTVGIVSVIADPTAPSDVATGVRSKRPDLVLFPADPALHLQFAMEAKLIRQATCVANELLGEEGFGCLIRAVYPYETNDVVGLMGYVESSMALEMINEARRYTHEDARLTVPHFHDHEPVVSISIKSWRLRGRIRKTSSSSNCCARTFSSSSCSERFSVRVKAVVA